MSTLSIEIILELFVTYGVYWKHKKPTSGIFVFYNALYIR